MRLSFSFVQQIFQLYQSFLHLDDSSGTVNKLNFNSKYSFIVGVVEKIGSEKREQTYSFSRSRRHFEDGMTGSIECFFEVAHIGLLLREDEIVGEDYG